jgi:hypothetical protein
VSSAQLVAHAGPAHTYPVAHGMVAPAAQVPLPSHFEGDVAVPFAHEPGAQVVPALTGPQTPSMPWPFSAAVLASQG